MLFDALDQQTLAGIVSLHERRIFVAAQRNLLVIFENRGQTAIGEIQTQPSISAICRNTAYIPVVRTAEFFLFDPSKNSQRLSVTLKAAIFLHAVVESTLAVMSERRMSQIMRKARKFHQIDINRVVPECRFCRIEAQGNSFCDLPNFQ